MRRDADFVERILNGLKIYMKMYFRYEHHTHNGKSTIV